ncbi:MAG TPA: insulinase family protein [Fimbriimonadaceae bacterium]|nr:insulinase family protein [Fimbriimonadaceae bacterium]
MPNGAITLVERLDGASSLSVQLFASTKSTSPTDRAASHRHLLEHLVARGRAGRLDQRLELSGMFLRARTFRDFMHFEISCAPTQLDEALSAIAEIMAPPSISQAMIEGELPILEQELALVPSSAILAAAAWRVAYGELGADPVGSLEHMRNATRAELVELHRELFRRSNLVLAVSGQVPVRSSSAKLASVLDGGERAEPHLPRPIRGKPGRAEAVGAFGEARAAIVGDYRSPATMATLAAALALAAQLQEAFVTYTPSRQGMVTLGRTTETSGVGLLADHLASTGAPELVELGRNLAAGWVEGQLREPSTSAFLRGALLVLGPGERPELMLDSIRGMTAGDFADGLRAFGRDRAVTIVGGAR